MEIVLKFEACFPLEQPSVKQEVTLLLHKFLERWIPSTSKVVVRRNSTLIHENCQSLKNRMKVIFERLVLDERLFSVNHFAEFSDKQTLMSRMCASGDCELVSHYCSLLSSSMVEEVLRRVQTDGSWCLLQAVRSGSIALVEYLLSEHDYMHAELSKTFEGHTMLDVARSRNADPKLLATLKHYGAQDHDDVDEESRPTSHASNAGFDLFEKNSDASHHIGSDDDLLNLNADDEFGSLL